MKKRRLIVGSVALIAILFIGTGQEFLPNIPKLIIPFFWRLILRMSYYKFRDTLESETSHFLFYGILLAILVIIIPGLILIYGPKRQAKAIRNSESSIVLGEQKLDHPYFAFTPQTSSKPQDIFSIENEARKTLSQIIGGFVVIFGLFVSGFTLLSTQKEAERNRADAEKNRAIALEGQITDRYTKAISQLGDSKLEIRLGGIYALERIANDSERDHRTIMEVLTAYIRDKGSIKNRPINKALVRKEKIEGIGGEKNDIPTDIQAILTVLIRRRAEIDNNPLDLEGCFLQGVQWQGAHFNNANLSGTDLSYAQLTEAKLEKAKLSNAKLIKSSLGAAILRGADLSNSDLRGAVITQRLSVITPGNFGPTIYPDLSKASFYKANLSDASLFGAYLYRTSFREADLSNTEFSSTSLEETDLYLANLKGAKFRKATFYKTNVQNANFSDAILDGANLSTASGLTFDQISVARIDNQTTLPLDIEENHKEALKLMRQKTERERQATQEKFEKENRNKTK